MKLSSRLDCDLVAVENADQLTLLVELTAPEPTGPGNDRPAATLQIVLDRSGSMAGDRLEGAITALLALVDRLDPRDNLGVVAFDNQVQVVVPAGPLTDKAAVKRAIRQIQPGGSTDLSGGYLRGLQEARRVAGPSGATVLLISDGHANAGITDPAQLGKVAVDAQSKRITTSTLGFGLGYDVTLLAALAQGGAGNELFAEQADTATALIAGEVEGLLEQVAQAASLRVTLSPHVTSAVVLNDLSVAPLADGLLLELGSFYAGETRRLVLTLDIPGIAALGLAEVATLELTYVGLADLVQHTLTMPVHVNVVPGDQAAGRVPDAEVRSEALFQRAQQVKKESSRLLSEGRVAEARGLMQTTSRTLRSHLDTVPEGMFGEFVAEADLFDALADEATVDASRAARASSFDMARKSRSRGRRSRGATYLLSPRDGLGSDLSIEELELLRVVRLAPAAGALTQFVGTAVPAELCGQIAGQLSPDHPLQPWFARAASGDGFDLTRT